MGGTRSRRLRSLGLPWIYWDPMEIRVEIYIHACVHWPIRLAGAMRQERPPCECRCVCRGPSSKALAIRAYFLDVRDRCSCTHSPYFLLLLWIRWEAKAQLSAFASMCLRNEVVYYICFQSPVGAGTNCENQLTSIERSYAHCSMHRYVHPRTFYSILGMSYAHYPLADQALSRRCIHACMIA